MQTQIIFLIALCMAFAAAFQGSFSRAGSSRVSMSFDLDRTLNSLARNKIVTKTAQLGLLTRLEKAGFKLTTAAPLLVLADKYDVLGYLEASSDTVLPLAAKAIDLAPGLLPVAAVALKTSPSTFFGGAAASAAAAAALIAIVPDDSITSIAFQTALAIPLGVILPGALVVGGVVLNKLK